MSIAVRGRIRGKRFAPYARRRSATERDARPQERPEHGADARAAGERHEDRRGQEEDEQGPAEGGDHEGRAEVADQDVLRHVRREELVVGDPVERPHEGEERYAEAGSEQRDAIPPGEIRAPASAQPHHGLGKQKRGDYGGENRNHGSIVPPIDPVRFGQAQQLSTGATHVQAPQGESSVALVLSSRINRVSCSS